MIFVDTGAWFAAAVPKDIDHESARTFLETNSELLVTTDYIMAELLNLFRARREFDRALEVGPRILEGAVCELLWVEPRDVHHAWTVFRQYRDKEWSFTDCLSFAVIQRLAIKKAFAFDNHFRQFGNIEVLP